MPRVKKQISKKLIEPALPAGFRDFLPEEAIEKNKIIKTISETFESYGFEPIETPAVERTEVLMGAEEGSSKIIFKVQGSKEKKSDMALRFDLTVPLARFIASNPQIIKPFKRYQIGRVWRGESPQAGRYREFTQADIDIVGVKNLDAESDIIRSIYETLKKLGFDDSEFFFKINFRKDAFRLLEEAGVKKEKQIATLTAVDKKEKLPLEKWIREIKISSGLTQEGVKQYVEKLNARNDSPELIELIESKIKNFVTDNFYANGGIITDPAMVRGLNYYTGIIFEVVCYKALELGSIAAGGRYDGLTARFSPQAYPAVGGSIGVDRILLVLQKLGKIMKKKTCVDAMFFSFPEIPADETRELENLLRTRKINVSRFLGEDKTFQNQLAYAVKKEIPIAVIYGPKEIKTGNIILKIFKKNKQVELAKNDIEKIANFVKNEMASF